MRSTAFAVRGGAAFALLLGLAPVATLPALAQDGVAAPSGPPAGAAAAAAPAAAPSPEPPVTAGRSWDASIGLVARYGPDFSGAAAYGTSLSPGFYLRYGRLSIATRSAFVSRSADAGARGGLRLDLSPSEAWRISLGLRYDPGRKESSSEDLRGMGDVPATVRARLSSSYPLAAGIRLGGAVTVDLSGRGGGNQGDIGLSRGFTLTPSTSASLGAGWSFAGDRYMQTYYGVTPEQSARSGYPVYEPKAGLRDASLNLAGRTELDGPWALFYGASASRLLGPAAASPLTRQRSSWGLNAGIVYRF